ncbi:WbqC family protein [Gracilimonas sp.]|uniref:WbqC family protein n=1 Tax=Gracilimonas sp. TaxID=1974203 RepID=UPI002870FCEF|nr:WbqC family protein [Gracilimonas sp.]
MTPSPHSNKILSIHQPNYIPWLGYFYKIIHSDVFVFLDSVQYPRGQSFSARNKVKTPNGPTWLTIPISVPEGQKGKASFLEVDFATDKWRKKHLRTLHMSYAKAPFYEEVREMIEPIISNATSFVELNISLIEKICEYLEIETKRIRLSNILDEYGEKTQLIIDICEAVNVDTYLSGTGGGKEYNNEDMLNQHGIKLIYSDFKHPEYEQLWGDFESNMSIIDLLMNHGKNSRKILLDNK